MPYADLRKQVEHHNRLKKRYDKKIRLLALSCETEIPAVGSQTDPLMT